VAGAASKKKKKRSNPRKKSHEKRQMRANIGSHASKASYPRNGRARQKPGHHSNEEARFKLQTGLAVVVAAMGQIPAKHTTF
jgi:hypothetical protein